MILKVLDQHRVPAVFHVIMIGLLATKMDVRQHLCSVPSRVVLYMEEIVMMVVLGEGAAHRSVVTG